MCVCVCVCVTEREIKKKKERERVRVLPVFFYLDFFFLFRVFFLFCEISFLSGSEAAACAQMAAAAIGDKDTLISCASTQKINKYMNKNNISVFLCWFFIVCLDLFLYLCQTLSANSERSGI